MLKKRINRKGAFGCASLLLLVGTFFLSTARECRRDVHVWRNSKPVEMNLDLSRPGEYTATFRQICPLSKGSEMYLVLPPDSMTHETLSNRLAHVRFTCRILDNRGRLKAWKEFRGNLLSWGYSINGAVPVLRIPKFENGDYTMSVLVTRGSNDMRRVPLKIIGTYMLDGMEIVPALVAFCIGLLALVFGSVLAGRSFALERKRVKEPKA